MNLHLYKTPYYDPLYPQIVRLLFEGKVPNCDNDIEADFYVYVWLHLEGYLYAFQVVLADTITLAFQLPSQLRYGKVSRDIVNRAATAVETTGERQQLIEAIDIMESEEFPVLLNDIKKIVRAGKEPEKVLLSKNEQMQLYKLYNKIL